MAKGAGGGYKSAINIGLSQTPKTTNPDIFNDLLESYNAIHILNASQDSIVEALYGNDEDATPDVNMKFIRSFWTVAAEKIDVGNCVRGSHSLGGVVKGHRFSTTGFALTSAEPTTENPHPPIRVGFGPATIKLDGLISGDTIWTTDGGDSLSDPYRGQLIQSGSLKNSAVMGKCFMDGYLIFCPGWYNSK